MDTKIHIFPDNSNKSFCGLHEVHTGGGQFSEYISNKTIKEDRDIICKRCLSLLLKKREGK